MDDGGWTPFLFVSCVVGETGASPSLQQMLLPLLHQYQVDAYLSSHDHSLQHLTTTAHCELFVSGAAGAGAGSIIALKPALEAVRFAALNRGFAVHSLSSSVMKTTFYDVSGSAMYVYSEFFFFFSFLGGGGGGGGE